MAAMKKRSNPGPVLAKYNQSWITGWRLERNVTLRIRAAEWAHYCIKMSMYSWKCRWKYMLENIQLTCYGYSPPLPAAAIYSSGGDAGSRRDCRKWEWDERFNPLHASMVVKHCRASSTGNRLVLMQETHPLEKSQLWQHGGLQSNSPSDQIIKERSGAQPTEAQ